MKKKTAMRLRSVLALTLCFVLALAGCTTPGGGDVTTPDGTTPSGTTPSGTTPSEPGSGTTPSGTAGGGAATRPPVPTEGYPDGAMLDGIGDRMDPASAALVAPSYEDPRFRMSRLTTLTVPSSGLRSRCGTASSVL